MNEVTRILSAIEQGDPRAAEQLLPLWRQLQDIVQSADRDAWRRQLRHSWRGGKLDHLKELAKKPEALKQPWEFSIRWRPS